MSEPVEEPKPHTEDQKIRRLLIIHDAREIAAHRQRLQAPSRVRRLNAAGWSRW